MPSILLIEDHQVNREMLKRWLVRRAFEVHLAKDGEEGIRLAKEIRPDLIIMDMGLPELDGWSATRLLKADETTAAIPILGVSAYAMSGDRQRGLEAGCDDYEIKPVDFERLMGKIDQLLRGKKAESGEPTA